MTHFERSCDTCSGKGELSHDGWFFKTKPCDRCNGLGALPTKEGEALIAFVLKYVMVGDARLHRLYNPEKLRKS